MQTVHIVVGIVDGRVCAYGAYASMTDANDRVADVAENYAEQDMKLPTGLRVAPLNVQRPD